MVDVFKSIHKKKVRSVGMYKIDNDTQIKEKIGRSLEISDTPQRSVFWHYLVTVTFDWSVAHDRHL